MAYRLEYAISNLGRRRNWRAAGRISAIIFVSLALCWSLLMPSHLIISNHGLPVTNEGFSVSVLVHHPEFRSEFRAYSIKSFAAFHFVKWGEWHRDGRYVLIPKWAMILLASATLVGVVALVRRRAAR